MKSLLLVMIVSLVACQKAQYGGVSFAQRPKANSATIVVQGAQVADGVTPTTIDLWLTNYAGQPLVNYQADLEVSGSGNQLVPCTASNDAGFAECWLISTVAEEKVITVKGNLASTPAVVSY